MTMHEWFTEVRTQYSDRVFYTRHNFGKSAWLGIHPTEDQTIEIPNVRGRRAAAKAFAAMLATGI